LISVEGILQLQPIETDFAINSVDPKTPEWVDDTAVNVITKAIGDNLEATLMKIYVDTIFSESNSALKAGTFSSQFVPIINLNWYLTEDPAVFWNRIQVSIIGIDTPDT